MVAVTEALLGAILTIDLAQFGIVLEHRGRLAAVEKQVADRSRPDGGEPADD